jgi:hypothetical protein
MHTERHTNVHTHAQTCTWQLSHPQHHLPRTHTHTRTHTHRHTHKLLSLSLSLSLSLHSHTHTHLHTYSHTHQHTHTHARHTELSYQAGLSGVQAAACDMVREVSSAEPNPMTDAGLNSLFINCDLRLRPVWLPLEDCPLGLAGAAWWDRREPPDGKPERGHIDCRADLQFKHR